MIILLPIYKHHFETSLWHFSLVLHIIYLLTPGLGCVDWVPLYLTNHHIPYDIVLWTWPGQREVSHGGWYYTGDHPAACIGDESSQIAEAKVAGAEACPTTQDTILGSSMPPLPRSGEYRWYGGTADSCSSSSGNGAESPLCDPRKLLSPCQLCFPHMHLETWCIYIPSRLLMFNVWGRLPAPPWWLPCSLF